MDGKLFFPFLFGLFFASAVAGVPAKYSPILPEVTKELEAAHREVDAKTFGLARAHAELVLLDSTIPYSVSFQGVPKSRRKVCEECLESAIDEWQKDLDGSIKFALATGGEATSLVVQFKPSVTMKKEQVAGYVNWVRNIKTETDGKVTPIFRADLQIRVKDLGGQDMPLSAMRHAAMHELGHVLGLDDSPRLGDVMGPLDIDNPVSRPSGLEVETVKSFRGEATQIINLTNVDQNLILSGSKS